jgi:hypothetical protein
MRILALSLLAGCTGGACLPTEDTDVPADPDTDTDTGDTDTGDTGDTGDTENPEPVACPSFAPFDRDGAWWTYDAQGYAMTFTATGATEWHDLTVYGQVLDMSEYGVTVTVWYTCEADGLHQAGTDVLMQGQATSTFYEPQPLLMPAEPQVGDTWSVDYTVYEEDGGSYLAYAGGTPETFHGTISATETLELESGTFDTWVLDLEQQGGVDRMWWADGVGFVRQGIAPDVVDLLDYGPM